MRIFFSDIQKCDVWIIYCCNKLLWLWIYTTFFRCGWGEKLWQIWFLFLTTSVFISLVLWTFLFPKMAIQEEKCFKICYVYLTVVLCDKWQTLEREKSSKNFHVTFLISNYIFIDVLVKILIFSWKKSVHLKISWFYTQYLFHLL